MENDFMQEYLAKVRQAPPKKDRVDKYAKAGVCPSEVIRAMVCLCDISGKQRKAICGILLALYEGAPNFDMLSQPLLFNVITKANIKDKLKIRLLFLANLITEPDDVVALVDTRVFSQIYANIKLTLLLHSLKH